MLTTLFNSFQYCLKHHNKWFSCLVYNLTSLCVNCLIMSEFSGTPKTSKSKGSFPATISKKYKAIDGPWLHSHKIKVKFPEVFFSRNLHIFSSYHLIPFIIVLCMFDNFVWRKQFISGIKSSGWLLNFRILSFLSFNICIIFSSILQPEQISLFLFHIKPFSEF